MYAIESNSAKQSAQVRALVRPPPNHLISNKKLVGAILLS